MSRRSKSHRSGNTHFEKLSVKTKPGNAINPPTVFLKGFAGRVGFTGCRGEVKVSEPLRSM